MQAMPLAPAQGQNERESLCPGRSAVCPERLWAARAQAFSHTPGRSLVLVPEPADRATGRGGGWTEGPAPDAGAELVSLPGDPGVLSAAGRFEKERGVGWAAWAPCLLSDSRPLSWPCLGEVWVLGRGCLEASPLGTHGQAGVLWHPQGLLSPPGV